MSTDELAHLRRAAHANAQRVTELEAELAHARPKADALDTYCAAVEAFSVGEGGLDAVRDGRHILLAAHRATTPSQTPSSHVIVERAELERLRELARVCGQGYISGVDSGP